MPPLVTGSTESLQPSPKTDITSPTGPMTPENGSNSDKDMSMIGGFEDLDRTFELKDFSHISPRTNEANPIFDESSEHRLSFDDQSGEEYGKGRKDSFMLYTPDEEQAVVMRLDRRLVLFMAFLYMLSFLDRSSKFRRACSLPLLSAPRHWQRKDRRSLFRIAAQLIAV